MIARSRLIAGVALAGSLALHGTGAALTVQRAPVLIEGGGPPGVALLGNDFADMVAGVSHPVAPDTPPETATAQPAPPAPAHSAQTPPPDTARTPPPERAPTPPAPRTPPAAVDTRAPAPADPAPAPTLAPVAPATAATTPETAAQTALAPVESDLVEIAPRPPQRPARIEAAAQARAAERAAERAQARQQPRRQPAAAPRGTAAQNRQAGTATGSRDGTQAQAGTGGRSQAAGNAAASNYPGQVMRRLSRVGRPRVGQRGTAVVRFTVAGNGGLASVAIARSSGHGRLDQAALTLVRRAAPFPPPPPGAQRSFQIDIVGR